MNKLFDAMAKWHAFTIKQRDHYNKRSNEFANGYAEGMDQARQIIEMIAKEAGMELNTLEWAPIDTDEAELLNREAVC